MSVRWLAAVLGGWLAAALTLRAEEPPDSIAPVTVIAAFVPETPAKPTDRPTELPNIDPRLDLVPLARPPAQPTPCCPTCPPRGGCGNNFDPSYLFLPDRNPGLRQAPCPCLPLGDAWFDAAYFLGTTQNASIPALATSGGSGVPGTPGVATLHAGQGLEQPFRSGLRLDTGVWFDRCHDYGIDASFFFMQSTQAQFGGVSTGSPVLAQPYYMGNTPAANILAAPGESHGSITVNSPVNFLGADVNSRMNLFCEDHGRLDFIAGYRFIQMSEQIDINSASESLSGTTRSLDDTFRTLNLFNGAQIGLAGEYRFDHFYVSGAGKIAFGLNTSELTIAGSTRTQTGSSITTVPGGLLTSSATLGTSHGENFGVVPEADFSVGYQINEHWRAFVGYTFIYMSSVQRPGQAIDLNVSAPSRYDPNSEFWMHGINLGIEARY